MLQKILLLELLLLCFLKWWFPYSLDDRYFNRQIVNGATADGARVTIPFFGKDQRGWNLIKKIILSSFGKDWIEHDFDEAKKIIKKNCIKIWN